MNDKENKIDDQKLEVEIPEWVRILEELLKEDQVKNEWANFKYFDTSEFFWKKT